MREQVEPILASLASRWADRRLHVFDVRIAGAGDGVVELAGRVLERANLDALRREMAAKIPAIRVDDSGVVVLQRQPKVMRVIATNLTDLHAEPSFLSEMLTQVTNGTELEILEEREKWSFVRLRDGYMGWALARFLGELVDPLAFTHIVSAPTTFVRADADDAGFPLTRVLAGTSLCVTQVRGLWARFQPIGAMLPGGWLPLRDLRKFAALPLAHDEAGRQIILDARELMGTYYLWGGCTAWGIDCSGLAQLCHRLSGYEIPRDSDMQFVAGRPVGEPFAAGDLLYFHNEARTKIGHVGIATGAGWNMIHSSRSRNGVYEEDAAANESLRSSFAGARSFLP